MIQINLLPWRENERKRKKIRTGSLALLMILLSLFVILIFHLHYRSLYRAQKNINEGLHAAISSDQTGLNAYKTKQDEMDDVVSQLKIIMGLYKKSYQTVTFLNKLPQLIPDTVTLTKILREGNNITFNGMAVSENDITHFMQNLSQSPDFYQPVLISTQFQTGKTNNYRNFQIQVVQKGKT